VYKRRYNFQLLVIIESLFLLQFFCPLVDRVNLMLSFAKLRIMLILCNLQCNVKELSCMRLHLAVSHR